MLLSSSQRLDASHSFQLRIKEKKKKKEKNIPTRVYCPAAVMHAFQHTKLPRPESGNRMCNSSNLTVSSPLPSPPSPLHLQSPQDFESTTNMHTVPMTKLDSSVSRWNGFSVEHATENISTKEGK